MENRSTHSKSRHKGVLNMMTSIVLVILASGIPRNVFAIQSWSEQPIYHEVNPGGQVVMPCIVLNKRGECRWEKDAQPVGIHPGKYEWAATSKGSSPDPGDCSLRVLDANLEFDDGVWQCQVTPSSFRSKDALISQGAQLVVRGNIIVYYLKYQNKKPKYIYCTE